MGWAGGEGRQGPGCKDLQNGPIFAAFQYNIQMQICRPSSFAQPASNRGMKICDFPFLAVYWGDLLRSVPHIKPDVKID